VSKRPLRGADRFGRSAGAGTTSWALGLRVRRPGCAESRRREGDAAVPIGSRPFLHCLPSARCRPGRGPAPRPRRGVHPHRPSPRGRSRHGPLRRRGADLGRGGPVCLDQPDACLDLERAQGRCGGRPVPALTPPGGVSEPMAARGERALPDGRWRVLLADVVRQQEVPVARRVRFVARRRNCRTARTPTTPAAAPRTVANLLVPRGTSSGTTTVLPRRRCRQGRSSHRCRQGRQRNSRAVDGPHAGVPPKKPPRRVNR
jgi:hypothetical protein